jgi:Bacterial Ig domain/Glycosyl hydrolases family 16
MFAVGVFRRTRTHLVVASAVTITLAAGSPTVSAAVPAPLRLQTADVQTIQTVAPAGNLTGWRQIFVDDFSTNVALGNFPAAVSTKWGAYPSPWKDTSGHGTYSPAKTVSISGGVLNEFVHTENGVPMVATLLPKVPGSSISGQTYGRYAVRFRSDSLAGYKMAWMLWPDSDNNQRDGEIDLPERNLDSPNIYGFVHHRNSTGPPDQDWAKLAFDGTQWHTTVVEWSPNLVVFSLDGVEIKRATTRVPSTPMHWVLQTETALGVPSKPAASVAGNVQIDWVAAWAYDPAARPAVDKSGPTVAVTSLKNGAVVGGTVTLQATAADPSGVNAVKWFVDGVEVGYDGVAAPWSDPWNTRGIGNGQHWLFAKAHDVAGNWGTSPSIKITVTN